MSSKMHLFTSESVTEGHPDKICDQISDSILDAIITREALLEEEGYVSKEGERACVKDIRCACETFVTKGTVVIAGEIRTQAYVDVHKIARDVIAEIGYTTGDLGFDAKSCSINNMIHGQSADIAMGVDNSFNSQSGTASDSFDKIGAGDQGMMFGYACDETDVLMPLPIYLAHKIAHRLADVRKSGELEYLRPDGKCQVTVRYVDNIPKEITTIVVSTQHDPSVHDMSVVKRDILEHVVGPVMESVNVPWQMADIYVNPTGRFVVGGPAGDTGLTGRKIIVDTYGGMGRHGGGAFSGKDPTKVDRSAAYAARYVAKNIVAAKLAKRCEIELAYAIGVAHPVSVMVDTFGTGVVPDEAICDAVSDVFDLRPAAIISTLDLFRPIYAKTAAYGHFGREDVDFTWEKCDKVQELSRALS